jgi:hypothetical protein
MSGVQRVPPLDLPQKARGRELSQAAREQEVARVAAGDVHHVATETEALDVFPENDLHRHV